MDIQEIFKGDSTFRYRLLSRMQSDCDYYLGYGGRFKGHLWAGDEKKQIEYMKAIWNSFGPNEKPEWLSFEQILDYEKQMVPERPHLTDLIQSASSRAGEDSPTVLTKQMLFEKYGYLMDKEHGQDEELLMDILKTNGIKVERTGDRFYVQNDSVCQAPPNAAPER